MWATSFEAVVQAFHILNNFDIPIGSQHPMDQIPKGLPSATQFTAATDLSTMKFYYRTAWNSNIRCIDLMNIDFSKVKYQSHPLDLKQVQPVEMIHVK
jgi:choloylglycine hydrolase